MSDSTHAPVNPSNERLWTRLTLVVLAWVTLLMAAAFLLISPGQSSRAADSSQAVEAAATDWRHGCVRLLPRLEI